MIRHDTLRFYDQWLGVPLCALLTALRRAASVFQPSTTRPIPRLQRVLFIQLAESGSMVLADPAMRKLAGRPGVRAYCLTFNDNRGSLAITGTVPDDQIRTIRHESFTTLLIDTWHFLRWIRQAKIDAVVDLELFSRLTAVLCWLTGIPERIGFHRRNGTGLYRGDLYTRPVAFNPDVHMAENYLQLVDALPGIALPPPMHATSPASLPKLRQRKIDTAEMASVQTRLKALLPAGKLEDWRLIVINANASTLLPHRRWPEAMFIALIGDLLAHFPDTLVLLIGAANDHACTSSIASQTGHNRCVDAAGDFALEQLPALFSLSAVMVSNDSGPAHFAAVTALPVIVLFGPETPRLFRPLGNATVISANLACSPCVNVGNQRRTFCTDNQCMKRISVAEVFAATCAALAVSKSRPLPIPSQDRELEEIAA